MAFNYKEYDGEDHHGPSLNQLWADTTADKDLLTRTDALTRIAVRLADKDDHYGAISAAQTAGELFEQLNDAEQVGHSHYFVGWQYSELGSHDEAKKEFALASDYFQQAVCDEGRGEALRMLGYSHAKLDDFATALVTWHESIRILEACFRYGPAGAILLEIGERQETNNHYEMALETYRKAFEDFQIAEDMIGIGRAHVAIAHILLKTGQGLKALDHLRDAISVFEYIPEPPYRQMDAVYELGVALDQLGFKEEAKLQFFEASQFFRPNALHSRYADCQIYLARYHEEDGHLEKARKMRRQARALYEGCGRLSLVMSMDLSDATAKYLDGDDFGAEEILSKIVEKFDDETPLKLVRDVRILLSEIYLGWHQYERALAAIEEFSGSENDWAFDQKIRWFNAQAAALISLGRVSESLPLLEKAIALDLSESLPGQTARSYELLAQTVDPTNKAQSLEFSSNSAALYLKAGQTKDAARVTAGLAPTSPQAALEVIRSADGQLSFLTEPKFWASE